MKQEIKERIELINKGIVPAGYKKTLVGICPIEWETSKLSELSTFVGGGTPSTKNRSYWEGNIPWISSSDISDEGIYNIFVKKFINEESINNSATKLIPEDSILVVTRVGVGKLAINTVKICTSQDFTNLINIKMNKKFLAFYLKELINKNLKNTQGTSIKGITTKELGNYEIFSNNILEQQKIAEILDCATRQVELQEQLVDKLKVQKKALMQRVFNGEYETISIQEALNKNYLREIKPKELQKYDGTKNYLSTSSIIQDEIVLIEDVVTYENRPSRAQMKPLENSVWFAKMTNSIKVIKANKNLEDNYILSTGFYGFLCDEINLNSNFLKQVFLSDYFNKTKDLYSEGSSQNGIKSNALEKLLIPFIELEKQLEIAEWLSFLDKNILLQQKLLEQYKLQQKALMQLLLTGIVRVC